MLDKNKIYNVDVLDGLRQLDDKSIDLIITSPPYNKAGLNGKYKDSNITNWTRTIRYGGDINSDCMPEEEYQEWQLEVLKECFRVTKDDGSLFYNHKNRCYTKEGTIISPYMWLLKSPFLIKQEIIWDRKGGAAIYPNRYIPSTEQIFWLTKSRNPRFLRSRNIPFKAEVWTLNFDTHNPHPAPFPITIPDNIIPCVAQGEKIVVLDPFMGSGTVALSAIKHNCDYIGFEKYPEYIEQAEKRIEAFQPQLF